jgi:folate-binding protein YgfZ
MTKLVHLADRGVLEISGADRISFLQGMVSNDVTQTAPGRAIWAALLTPQGKWLADFFILTEGERLLLECERAQVPDLAHRLSRFKLRAQVAFQDLSQSLFVHVAWNGDAQALPDAFIAEAPDPRLPNAGTRILSNRPLATNATPDEWQAHRLQLGLPDGTRDLEAEKTVLLEAGFDELSGVSWTKGCYMGQELTARTKYRGLVKRRLFPVQFDGTPAPPGALILQNNREVGTMRSAMGTIGLALLRLDSLDGPLICEGVKLTPTAPDWMNRPSQP